MLQKLVGNWFQFSRRHRWAVIGVWMGLMAFLGWSITQLDVSEDPFEALPESEAFSDLTDITDNIGLQTRLVLAFTPEDTLSADSMYTIGLAAKTKLETDFKNELKEIQLEQPDVDIDAVLDHYNAHLPSYLGPDDYRYLDSITHSEAFVSRINDNHASLYTPEGLISKKQVFADPVGLTARKLEALEDYQKLSNYEDKEGLLFLKDGKSLVIQAQVAVNTKDFSIAQALQNKLKTFQSDMAPFGVEVHAFSGFMVSMANSEQIQKDSLLTGGITVGLVLFLLFAFYRSWALPLVFLIPGVFGIAFSLGTLTWLQGSISGISIGAGAVVIGIVLDYSFHFFTHFRNEGSLRQTVTSIAAPLLTGCATTVLAFGALIFTNTEVLQDFGAFASLSLLGAAICVLFLLPTVLTENMFKGRKPVQIPWMRSTKWMNRIVVLAIVVITILSLRSAMDISFDSDLANLNYYPEALKKEEQLLMGIDPDREKRVYFIAKGATREEARMRNYELYEHLSGLESDGEVSLVVSVGSLDVPSEIVAEKNRQWNDFWSARPEITPLLDTMEAELGYQDYAFDGFKDRLTTISLGTPIPEFAQPLMDVLVDSSRSGWTYYSFVTVNKEARQALFDYVRPLEGVTAVDNMRLAEALVEAVQEDFNYIALVSSLLVVITLLLIYGRIELTTVTVLPMVISWIWILALASWLDIEFNLINIIITTFIFGLGDDFAIFITDGYLSKHRNGEDTISTYRTGILLSGITTIIGTGILILAEHPAVHSIALLSVVGLSSIIFVSLTLQPILFKWLITNRTEKGRAPWTAGSLFVTIFAFSYFLIGCLILTVLQFIFRLIPGKKKGIKLFFHRLLQLFCWSQLYIMLNVKKRRYGFEHLNFDKPSVIIANHQSFIDILAMIALHPKIIIFTNDWVYKSPFFGLTVRFADYILASKGVEDSLPAIKERIAEGYSIMIFPEGTRSASGDIKRFHKGAFLLAKQFQLDITPIILHGFNYTMQKSDFMLKNGTLNMKVLPRIAWDDPTYGDTYQSMTKGVSAHFKKEFREFSDEYGHSEYLWPRILLNYIYKSPMIEWYIRVKWRFERKNFDHYHTLIPKDGKVYDLGCGYGYLAYYLKYRAPQREVIGMDYDEEKVEVAQHCFDRPEGIRFEASDVVTADVVDADAIFIMDVLHYLTLEEQTKVLERAATQITKTGKIIVRDGVRDLDERHGMTELTEKYSTQIIGFNKTRNALNFFTKSFVTDFAKSHGLTCEIFEQSQKTSNILFILTPGNGE